MRYINIESIKLPDGWEEKVGQLFNVNEFNNLTLEQQQEEIERIKELIEKNSVLWRELKPLLAKLSYQKCWYCEMPNLGSDNDVDHFRPKSRVTGLKNNHDGYWWLAFDWRNYRFSCEHCNGWRNIRTDDGGISSGGKWNNFPVLDESQRAFSPIDAIEAELPLLLDPTNSSDVELLWFDEEGKAVPRINITNTTCTEHLRAHVSIEVYHLNHPLRVPERKKIYNYIKRLVRSGNRHYKIFLQNPKNKYARINLIDTITDLQALIAEEAPLSATANAYICGFRGKDSQWIDKFVLKDSTSIGLKNE